MKKSYLSTKRIAIIAIMATIAAILMVFDFPIAFLAPSFYKLDLSDLPCLIGTFALGPLAGCLIELLKILIKLIIKPTSTAFVGELANLLCGLSLCIPAGLIYKYHHDKKSALIGLIVGCISITIIGTIFNYYIMIPFYVNLYHIELEYIITAGKAIFPIINDKLSFVLCCVAPFNLLKGVIVCFITDIVYKRISNLIKSV